MMDPSQNPNSTPNFVPFTYNPPPQLLQPPAAELPYIYNPTPLQTYNPSLDQPLNFTYFTQSDTTQGHFTPQGITLPKVATQLHVKKYTKKAKKAKIVQSEWCEVCKISCNSKDVLDIHKLGKKHKKNLEKLNNPPNPIPAPVVASTSTPPTIPNVQPVKKPIIGPQENPDKVPSSNAIKSLKKKLAATEDIETKRRKVLDGGAAAEAVRTCTYCNVVCNSETVFNSHMSGTKHAATMKKYAAAMAGIAFVTG